MWRATTHGVTIPGSSMVEHAAVNRRVVGSSPARGAISCRQTNRGLLTVRQRRMGWSPRERIALPRLRHPKRSRALLRRTDVVIGGTSKAAR